MVLLHFGVTVLMQYATSCCDCLRTSGSVAPVTPPKVAPVTPPKEVPAKQGGVPGVTADSDPKKFLDCICITFSSAKFLHGVTFDFTKCKVCVYFNICCVTKGKTS